MAVTINELEMTDFPPLKLTDTSRVLKENEDTIIKSKLKTRLLWNVFIPSHNSKPVRKPTQKVKVFDELAQPFSFLVPILTETARGKFLK